MQLGEAQVRLGIIGPLFVADDDGQQIRLAAGRQRALLAALLVRANRIVPVDELAELVWDGDPPRGAVRTVRTYAVRLRQSVGPQVAARIETLDPGYLCRVADQELDVLRFEALCGDAGAALRSSRWTDAAEAAAGALELWRDVPLQDVSSQALRDECVTRLEQLRVQAIEDRIEAQLHLERDDRLIPELRQLTSTYPLRERLHAQLMVALARAGRQAEALETYRRAREVLVEELGIEPGPELQQTHEQILDAGVVSVAPAAAAAAGEHPSAVRAHAPVPRQLPAAVRLFTGRRAQLRLMVDMLGERDRDDCAERPVVIAAICGAPGAGKTALAVHFAHRVADQFPDGQLYVDLRGFDTDEPLPTADALAGFLRALGMDGRQVPATVQERAAVYRSMLTKQRTLIVLDNARDVKQVRPLLPGSGDCLVLVTSRDSLAGLVARDGAVRVQLDALPSDDALALLRALLGPRVDTESEAAATLAEQCSRLPLALRIAAERATTRPQAQLATLVSELADHRICLDLLGAGGDGLTDVRGVLSWSYRHLELAEARAFRLLALHPGAELDLHAAAALTNTTPEQASGLLDRLARSHLVRTIGASRFAMHDLLRVYGRERCAAEDGDVEQNAAVSGLLDHYLYTAAASMSVLYPTESHRRPHLAASEVLLAPVADPVAAQAWLDAERRNLVAVAAYAVNRSPAHATALAAVTERYFSLGYHLDEAVTLYRHALRAARLSADHHAEGTVLTHLGFVEWMRGRYEKAADYQQRALPLFREAADRGGQVRALHRLALIERSLGHFSAAADYAADELAITRQDGDRLGEVRALHVLATMEHKQGRWRMATRHFQEVMALSEALGDLLGQSTSAKELGIIELRRGRLQAAAEYLRRALSLCEQTGNVDGQAGALSRLGQLYLRRGDIGQAGEHQKRALTTYRELNDQHGVCEALTSLGLVELRAGRVEQAIAHFNEALSVSRRHSAQSLECEALNGLGEALLAAARTGHAVNCHAEALDTASRIGDPDERARAHHGLARARAALGEQQQARHHLVEALRLYSALDVPEADEVLAELGRFGAV